MKISAICISSSFTTIALALPTANPNEPWTGFFNSEPVYYPYGVVNPYYPPQTIAPAGPNSQPPPPPILAPIPYGRPYEESDVPYPPPPVILPYPYGGPYEDPGPHPLPQPPQPPLPQPHQPPLPAQYPSAPPPGPLDGPLRPSVPLIPPLPTPPTPINKLGKPVSEKPHDKKPLANKFAPEVGLVLQSPVVEDSSNKDDFDKDSIRYRVNVGGIQKGGGGTTNFHVYSDDNGNKRFSDELDEETEKYITENMIPKLGGKRKGGNRGGVWSVFGDK